jgi:hypothetical protein
VSDIKDKNANMLKRIHTFKAFEININLFNGNPLDELKLDLVIVNNENNNISESKVIEAVRTEHYMMIQIL